MSIVTGSQLLSNRPHGKIDSNFQLNQDSFLDEAFFGDYLAGTNLIYKCYSKVGGAASQPVWQICKISYDGNNNITAIQWPINGSGAVSNDYEFILNNRASYVYV